MHLDVTDADDATDLGAPVYCADNDLDSLTITIGGLNHPIGYISYWRNNADMDVTLFTPTEMLAQRL